MKIIVRVLEQSYGMVLALLCKAYEHCGRLADISIKKTDNHQRGGMNRLYTVDGVCRYVMLP